MKKIKNYKIIIAIIIAFNLIAYVIRLGGEVLMPYISDLLPVICSFITLVLLYQAYCEFKSKDFTKTAWLMILLGVCFDFIAESLYGILEIAYKVDMDVVFPTIADYFWCAAYIPIAIGLGMMYIGYKRSGLPMGNEKAYKIIAPSLVVLLAVVFYFILLPMIQDEETSLLEKVFYLFYPAADVLILVPAIILIYITSLFGKGTISKPWKFLSYGFILFTISDLLYSYLSWQELYGNGNFIDLGWNMGYLLLGLSALYQKNLITSIKEG